MARTDVLLNATVVGWEFDNGGNITGVRVRVAATAPEGPTNFRAIVHGSFQGYGVPRDPQPDLEP